MATEPKQPVVKGIPPDSKRQQQHSGQRRDNLLQPAEDYLQFRGYSRSLDGLRGFAITLVLFHHLWPYEWSTPITSALTMLSHISWFGVDLFFVLSGFLISGILLDTRAKPRYFRNFILRRSLRIFPLYFFFLFLAFAIVPVALAWLGRPDALLLENRNAWLWFLAYGSNFIPLVNDPAALAAFGSTPISGTENGVQEFLAITWSLSVEEHFYLFWPLLVFIFARNLSTVVLIVCALALGSRLLLLLNTENWALTTNMATFCRMDSLAIGSLLAWYCRTPDFDIQLWRQTAKTTLFCGLPLVSLYLVLVGGRGNPSFAVVGYTVNALVFAALLAVIVEKKSGILKRIFESKCLVTLGKYSYGLYLYHTLIWFLVGKFRAAELNPDGTIRDPEHFNPFFGSMLWDAPLRMLLVLGIAMAVTWLSFHLFEQRFLSLKKYFESK